MNYKILSLSVIAAAALVLPSVAVFARGGGGFHGGGGGFHGGGGSFSHSGSTSFSRGSGFSHSGSTSHSYWGGYWRSCDWSGSSHDCGLLQPKSNRRLLPACLLRVGRVIRDVHHICSNEKNIHPPHVRRLPFCVTDPGNSQGGHQESDCGKARRA